MNRRSFIKLLGAIATSVVAPASLFAQKPEKLSQPENPSMKFPKLPGGRSRWYKFLWEKEEQKPPGIKCEVCGNEDVEYGARLCNNCEPKPPPGCVCPCCGSKNIGYEDGDGICYNNGCGAEWRTVSWRVEKFPAIQSGIEFTVHMKGTYGGIGALETKHEILDGNVMV